MTEPTSRRVFFALWPAGPTQEALDTLAADAAKCCGGRRMQCDSLHVTLAFIGTVSPSQLAVLQDIAGKISGEPFDMQLDRLGCWPHNRIFWIGSSKPPSRQRRLFDVLVEGLAAAGYSIDKHSFVPHVTLVRNARCDNQPKLERPILWHVSEFVLAESCWQTAGPRYQVLNRWSLRPVSNP